MLSYRRPSALRLFVLVFALVTGLTEILGAMPSDAQAQTAPPQYTSAKVPRSTISAT